jgi:hypothetical protein
MECSGAQEALRINSARCKRKERVGRPAATGKIGIGATL